MANNVELSICGQGDSEAYIQVAHQHPVIIPKIKYPQERMLIAKINCCLLGWLGEFMLLLLQKTYDFVRNQFYDPTKRKETF